MHRTQRRKGTDIPYVAHLMAVAAWVLEHGGDEDTAIVALLHDAAEDQGGEATLAEIARRFGPAIAQAVRELSDSLADDPAEKAPWEDRKAAYLAHLPHASQTTLLVTLADKTHNATALLRDLERDGSATMARFNATLAQTVWYLEGVRDACAARDLPVADLSARIAGLRRFHEAA